MKVAKIIRDKQTGVQESNGMDRSLSLVQEGWWTGKDRYRQVQW